MLPTSKRHIELPEENDGAKLLLDEESTGKLISGEEGSVPDVANATDEPKKGRHVQL